MASAAARDACIRRPRCAFLDDPHVKESGAMSIFGSIMSKIFHHPKAQAAPQPTPATAAAPAAAAPEAAAAPSAPTPMAAVDVEAVLTVMAQDSPQTLDWRHSIVDLMKLLSLDSSLTARKELAGELGYTGDTNDSATMNIWLHKAVMEKLAANGGIVPNSLL
jgi:3-oxoacyl-ACP reductase-like protein